MTPSSSGAQRRRSRALWLAAATAALMSGLYVYLYARPVAPALLSDWLTPSLPGGTFPSLPLVWQLPSFLHMLAMLCAVTAVTVDQPRLQRPALLVTLSLGLALEFMQHPACANLIEACTGNPGCRALSKFKAYATGGTFDPLDVAAIFCAGFVAGMAIHRSNSIASGNPLRKESIL